MSLYHKIREELKGQRYHEIVSSGLVIRVAYPAELVPLIARVINDHCAENGIKTEVATFRIDSSKTNNSGVLEINKNPLLAAAVNDDFVKAMAVRVKQVIHNYEAAAEIDSNPKQRIFITEILSRQKIGNPIFGDHLQTTIQPSESYLAFLERRKAESDATLRRSGFDPAKLGRTAA